ncbi:hypothetical protein ACFQ1S_34605, partial [Kibdelosporangium lantanae]
GALFAPLRDRLTIPEVPAAVCEEIVGSLGLRFARLELETSDGVRTLAEVRLCEAEAEPVTFDLWHRGTVVGRMVVAPPEGREHLDEMTVQALASLAAGEGAAERASRERDVSDSLMASLRRPV